MYITQTSAPSKSGKPHICTLLRESYRQGNAVKNRTIANLSHCSPQEIAALRLALKHKENLSELGSIQDSIQVQEGASVGAVWTVHAIAKRLGLEKALGNSRDGKLALWQVMARVIDQGSRLSAVRLAQSHAACDVLGLSQGFDEDDLYDNLSWLAQHQSEIEQCLFKIRKQSEGKPPELFLYDVTSSYFEGRCNSLADWGYNRDRKKGKKQVVVGLLCAEQGEPLSVEVFRGNTNDLKTFGSQVSKVADRFGCQRVTMVGDRGMIKSAQIEQLKATRDGFFYITALTKPQIESLMELRVAEYAWFDEQICEVESEGIRYVLRRNPQRALDLMESRQSKRDSVLRLLQKKKEFLAQHRRAKAEVAQREIAAKITRLKLGNWVKVVLREGKLFLEEDSVALQEVSRLDGCYVVKSNLPKPYAEAQILHDRYKDLTLVEQAFRTSKTVHLEMPPWYVRKAQNTRGHALVVMLAYIIVSCLQKAWAAMDLTVEEGLGQLSTLCGIHLLVKGQVRCHQIPVPRDLSHKLLQAADVRLPEVLPSLGARVVTRKKLPDRRRKQ